MLTSIEGLSLQSPLQLAAEEGHVVAAKLLVAGGASLLGGLGGQGMRI